MVAYGCEFSRLLLMLGLVSLVLLHVTSHLRSFVEMLVKIRL